MMNSENNDGGKLESEFNVTFTVEEVFDVHSIADIKKHLLNHGVTLND